MLPEKYTVPALQVLEQRPYFDKRENPGSYRSGHRDNQLSGEPKPRLPESTRTFVQRAFATGVVERIDEKMKLARPRRLEQWERGKWLLVRYVFDDALTFEDAKRFVGVNYRAYAGKLYSQALNIVWESSSKETQQEFPRERVLVGKARKLFEMGHEVTPEVREKIGAASRGRILSQEHKDKIRAATVGKKKPRRLAVEAQPDININ